MRAPRETDLVAQCLQLLRLRHVFAWRVNGGAAHFGSGPRKRFVRFASINGISDILACLPPDGRLLAVEVKQPGRRVTPHQQAFLAAVCAAGGLALVVDDVRQLEAALVGGQPHPEGVKLETERTPHE
jgi:hypothetical protein